MSALLDRYLAAQLAGDRREALRVVLEGGPKAGMSVPELYLEVIQAAQYRIGELWQVNQVSVGQEHVATAISQLVVAHLYPLLPRRPSNGRRILVACVDGELHELGARMVADFFEMAGFDTRYLGTSTPADSLVAMIREDPADVLILSVTMSFHLPALRETALRVREAAGDQLKLGVGEHAFLWAPSQVAGVGADIYGRDALESVAATERIFALAAT